MSASPGTASVSVLPTASAGCSVAAPAGHASVAVGGTVARVGVAAPVSPFVAGVYLVDARATIQFRAWGNKQTSVWMGYGVTNTMYLQTPP